MKDARPVARHRSFRNVHPGSRHVVHAAVVVRETTLELVLVAAGAANEERAVVAPAEDAREEVVEVGRLHAVHVLVVACDLEQIEVETNPMDGIADLRKRIQLLRRPEELVPEADATEGIRLRDGEIVPDEPDRLQRTDIARHAMEFEQAVQAAHHLVALAPLIGLGIPGGEFLAV